MPTTALAASHSDVQDALDIRAINEQLLLTGLREQALAEQLQTQLAFTTAITLSLAEGVCALNTAGQFTFINPAAEHLLGWAAEDLLGHDVATMLPLALADIDSARANDSPLATVFTSGVVFRGEDALWPRRDGTTFPVAYAIAPIYRDDTVVGAVITFRDMTEAQRLYRLQEAYTALEVDVRVRKEAEQARQAMLQQLVTVQEEERRRIAHELHDQMGQDLTALLLGLKALADAVTPTAPADYHLAQVQALAARLGQNVRALAVQLRPAALDGLGLTVALTTYVEAWSVQAQVVADIHTTGLDGPKLPLAVETTLYRLVQEALTNVLKHAQASNVSVIIERKQSAVHLIVEDDGVGFDVAKTQESAAQDRRLGLIGMHERVAQLGGTITIESTPTGGTTLFVDLPLAAALEEEGDAEASDLPGS
jgi:PAS domain S-box-containing protein